MKGQCFSPLLTAGVSVFGAFLRSEFSEENLQFYLACEQYKHSSNNFSLQRRAKDICATYIQAGAPREVHFRGHIFPLLFFFFFSYYACNINRTMVLGLKKSQRDCHQLVTMALSFCTCRLTWTVRPETWPFSCCRLRLTPLCRTRRNASTPSWTRTATLASSSPTFTFLSCKTPTRERTHWGHKNRGSVVSPVRVTRGQNETVVKVKLKRLCREKNVVVQSEKVVNIESVTGNVVFKTKWTKLFRKSVGIFTMYKMQKNVRQIFLHAGNVDRRHEDGSVMSSFYAKFWPNFRRNVRRNQNSSVRDFFFSFLFWLDSVNDEAYFCFVIT